MTRTVTYYICDICNREGPEDSKFLVVPPHKESPIEADTKEKHLCSTCLLRIAPPILEIVTAHLKKSEVQILHTPDLPRTHNEIFNRIISNIQYIPHKVFYKSDFSDED